MNRIILALCLLTLPVNAQHGQEGTLVLDAPRPPTRQDFQVWPCHTFGYWNSLHKSPDGVKIQNKCDSIGKFFVRSGRFYFSATVVNGQGISGDSHVRGLDSNDTVVAGPNMGSFDNPVELRGSGFTVSINSTDNVHIQITNDPHFFGNHDVVVYLPGGGTATVPAGTTAEYHYGG